MKQNIPPNNKVGDSNQITREYFASLLIEMRHIDSVIPSTTSILCIKLCLAVIGLLSCI